MMPDTGRLSVRNSPLLGGRESKPQSPSTLMMPETGRLCLPTAESPLLLGREPAPTSTPVYSSHDPLLYEYTVHARVPASSGPKPMLSTCAQMPSLPTRSFGPTHHEILPSMFAHHMAVGMLT